MVNISGCTIQVPTHFTNGLVNLVNFFFNKVVDDGDIYPWYISLVTGLSVWLLDSSNLQGTLAVSGRL